MRKKVIAMVKATGMATRKEKVIATPMATHRVVRRRSLPLHIS